MPGTYAKDWENYRKLNFKVFADKADFIKQGEDAYIFNRQALGSYSKYKTDLNEQKIRTIYEKPDALVDLGKDFEGLMAKIDMGGVFEKAKLKITDDKRGVFSFGLASKGLYNPNEYFSQELATELPEEFGGDEYGNKLPGIVPVDFVKQVYVLDKRQFWYTSFTNSKRYFLTPQKEGTEGIKLGVKGAKLVYKTSVRKSYVMYEKKGGKAKMVELYIPVNGGISLQTVTPLFLAAKFFQFYGVMTRISVVRMYQETSDEYFMWGYPIKDYGDEMDFNSMALNGVDDGWWNGIRAVVCAVNTRLRIEEKLLAQGKPLSSKLTFGVDSMAGAGGLPEDRKSYVALYSRYRNWYMEQIEKGELPPLRVDKKLILSAGEAGLYNLGTGREGRILNEFWVILDTVDFQFNKPELTCARIYKRMVEDELTKKYEELKVAGYATLQIQDNLKRYKVTLISTFKTYVQQILIDTYTYPKRGHYAEPKESAIKLDEELDTKLEALNLYLKSI